MVLTLGWFSTGNGEGSRGLLTYTLNAIQRGELNAHIGYAFCNRDPGDHPGSDQFMSLVRSHNIPLETFSTRTFMRQHNARLAQVRAEHDREVLKRVQAHKVDMVVLAGYMLVLSPEMARAMPVTINPHPAAPGGPIGTWQEVIWKLIQERAPESGSRVHLVTEDLDMGPVLTYVLFPIQGGAYAPFWREVEGKPVAELQAQHGEDLPLFKAIRAEGVRREQPLLLETLLALAGGKVKATKQGVFDAQAKPLKAPLSLNSEVERRLRSGS